LENLARQFFSPLINIPRFIDDARTFPQVPGVPAPDFSGGGHDHLPVLTLPVKKR